MSRRLHWMCRTCIRRKSAGRVLTCVSELRLISRIVAFAATQEARTEPSAIGVFSASLCSFQIKSRPNVRKTFA